MFCRHSARAATALLVLGWLILSVGCGPNYKARGTVKGKVTFANTPLTTGSVTFHGKDNITGSATIDKEGNYVMNDAPLGDVKITVTVPKMPAGGIGKWKGVPKSDKDGKPIEPGGSGKSIPIMGDMPSRIVPIPEKYASPDTSGLTYTVAKGEQTHNLSLTP